MKKLGLIGGMGPESTIPYYHDIVYGVQEKVGEKFFPNLSIESLSVFEVLRMCEEKNYDGLVEYIMKGINNLLAAGVDFIAISANTPHIVYDKLVKKSPLPIVSIVESACEETKKRNISKVALLGTEFTMKEDFFKKPFIENNISVVIPTSSEIDYIAKKISEELELGIVKDETRAEFLKIINRMIKDENIEAVILGCTELPLLFKKTDLPVICLDIMEIHIQTIIEKNLEK